MKKLIITAHPSTKWFTHKIAKSFEKWTIEKWDTVEILDLYDKENTQDYLRFEEASNPEKDEKRDIMQEKIKQADELIFIFPVWWGAFPAIMKNFIDTNLQKGFAFKYSEKWVPNWLLKWKTAKIFATCDAPWFFYKLIIFPLNIKRYMKLVFEFCGFKINSFNLIDQMRKKWEEERWKILEKVYQIALK